LHLRRGGIGVPEANSGRACENLRAWLRQGGEKNYYMGYGDFRLVEDIVTVCNHVDNVRELNYGDNADWRDYNDDSIEDKMMLTNQIMRTGGR